MKNLGNLNQGSCLSGLAVALAIAGMVAADAAAAADPPNDQQIQRLLESAAQATGRPDHDFAANSIEHLMEQGKQLQLTQEQMDKIKAIRDQYAQSRSRRESTYKQLEMEALTLIHDRHSSLTAIETAVQKADQEHSKLRMAGIVALREAADVLRPEQYSQWRQNHASGQLAQSSRPEAGDGPSEPERLAPH